MSKIARHIRDRAARLRAGAWTETKPGTAAMALGMGHARHKAAQSCRLTYTLEAYALSLYGHAGMDHSRVSANCLSEFSHRAVQHLAEVVRDPTFPDSEFDQLHQRIQTDLANGMNEPEYLADRSFAAASMAGTPTPGQRLERSKT